MNPTLILLIFYCCMGQFSFAQNIANYKSWNPARDSMKVLDGQGWPAEVKQFYDRLPSTAEQTVRKEVWNLSHNSAGLHLRFRSNASEIIVRYVVTGNMQMPHMPATGVSGVDLYSKTIDGNWLWAAGKFSFGDTIVYRFTNLNGTDQQVNNREYYLYLPLYNTVKWMEINVPNENFFKPLPLRNDKPIVVYGTSIAQGACATRPGLTWTNILGRKMDRPVINLGFSGNGRLENELIELLAEVEARIYVLDCLPNLTGIASDEIKKRVSHSVALLQQKRPGVPILLTEHDGYTEEGISPVRKDDYERTNIALRQSFDSLKTAGVKNIYLLTKKEINQDIETMVDGVHPNDIGMMRYAIAYEKALRTILNEPAGSISTTTPVTQRRDAATYDFETRHNEVLQYNKTHLPEIVFIGNSITHFWGGLPTAPIANGKEAWQKYFGNKEVLNMGFGWDRIENVLWRIYHGELDGIRPKQIVLMIGTNNLQYNTDKEIVEGLQFLIKAIQSKQPGAIILLVGILPRRGMEERVFNINKLIAKISAGIKIKYADAGNLLLKMDKKINESLFSDGLHPNEKGYDRLGNFLVKRLNQKW